MDLRKLSLETFDRKFLELHRGAVSNCRERGHHVLDGYHFVLAWLTNTGCSPAGVSAERYDHGIEYLVKRGPPLANPPELKVHPALVEDLSIASHEAARFAGMNRLLDYRWVIPNLLHGEKMAMQVVGVLGEDMLQFLRDTLQVLADPFPGLAPHYVKKLELEKSRVAIDVLLHRRAKAIQSP